MGLWDKMIDTKAKSEPVKHKEPLVLDQAALEKHPLTLLSERARWDKSIKHYRLSSYDGARVYGYGPVQFEDSVAIAPENIIEQGLNFINVSASKGLDTIVSSEVSVFNKWDGLKTLHMPQVDCKFTPDHTLDWITSKFQVKFAAMTGVCFPTIFNSGHSYHAYSSTLLNQDGWLHFMGGLLLVPNIEEESFADTRWVGWQLQKGASALRLSCCDGHYLHTPIKVVVSCCTSPGPGNSSND